MQMTVGADHRRNAVGCGLLVFCGLALLTLLVRAPFWWNVGEDEAFFLVIGRQWLHGVLPYVGNVDVKPPGLFALIAASETVFGAWGGALKILEGFAVTVTAFGLWLIGRRHLSRGAGLAAAALYIVFSITLDGTTDPSSIVSAPFTTFGMLIGLASVVDRGRDRTASLFAAGILFGAACTIRQPAVFEAAALAFALLAGRSAVARLKTIAALAIGMAVCPLAFALLYLASGHLDALISTAVLAAVARVGGNNIVWAEAVLRILPTAKPILPAAVMASVIWAERASLRHLPAYPMLRLLGYWALGGFFGALATRVSYWHYYLPLLQPFCLLSGAFITLVVGRLGNRTLRLTARVLILAFAAGYAVLSVAPLFLAGRVELRAAERATDLMREAGLRSDERILAANRGLAIYLAAGVDPPTKFFHPQHFLCNFPLAGADTALATALDKRPAFILIADPQLHMGCEREDRHAFLRERVARDYCLLGHIESELIFGAPEQTRYIRADDSIDVYAEKNRPGVKCR
jgi:4-amino-4-deoxy-L-arabinose transferase-like glycosyltransferase